MLILLLLYFASHSWAKDYPRDSNYTLKYVPSCPDTGYFFQREPALNSLEASCYLCFCQGRNAAVCWPRENKKCDLQHYYHNSSIAKKETRKKRSPLGFGDIFFKDAARQVFNRGEAEVCKPYESSFSEGCPPADWCTGCTVCDCDADGHWDCHILSFCDDDKNKGKKQGIKGNNVPLSYPKPRKSASSKSSKPKKIGPIQTTRRPPLRTKTTTKRPPSKKLQGGLSKPTKPRSLIQKGKSVKPLIIKQNDKNPKVVKSSSSKKVLNGSETDINKQVIQSMMSAMQRAWAKQFTSALPDIVSMVQKRSFGNRAQTQNKKGNTPGKYKRKAPAKKSGKTHSFNKSLLVRKQKRQEQKKKELQRKREIQNKALAAKNNAATKQVPKAVSRNNKLINRSNKKTTKASNKPTTTKPNNKPNHNSNNKRKKRELNLNNQTDTSYNISDVTANVQHVTEQKITVESPTTTDPIDTVTTETMYTNSNYYKYSVHNFTTEAPRVSNDTKYNDATVEGFIGKVDNETNVGQRFGKHKLNLANEIPNEVANDIKLTKWSEIKMFQVKENATNINLNKTDESENERINKINETKANAIEDHRKQISWGDIERKIDRTTKKYSLLRMVNTNNCKNKRGNEINLENLSETSLSSKIENLRNVLKRLLGEFRGSNSSTLENKKKKTNAIKYLKKFFNRIFFKDSNKTNINQKMRNNNHTIQMLCESFGPCVVNSRNKEILKKKIKMLNNETIQILKSLRIIKGLLRLIDIPYDTTITPFNQTSNFKRDIHKLNIILKNSFDDDKHKEKLSETQRIQINYIKRNTKVFTQSVAKFTKILNEIIELISIKGNNVKRRKWNFETKSKLQTNTTKVESVHKFKKLLQNYNMLHNAFIAKMIDMFTRLQSKHHDVTPKINKTEDVYGDEYYSKNVIKNLNRLKNLASALNPLRRQKRHAVRQDNAVEYLLMLMEYMFQQNQLDHSPVNDGIDLLIEAIKNAPDIKSVKKKVLQNNPLRVNDVNIAEPISNKNVSYEESISDNNISVEDSVNKILNEDSKSILNANDNSSSIDQGESFDEENESDLKLLNLRNANSETANEQAETKAKIVNEQDDMNFTSVERQRYKDLKDEQVDNEKSNDYDTSTDIPTNVYMAEGDALAEFDSRLEKASAELHKKTGIYNSELDEENNVEESLGVVKAANIQETLTKSTKAVARTESYVNAKSTSKFNSVKDEIRPKLHEKKAKIRNDADSTVRKIDNIDSAQIINKSLDQSLRKSSKAKNNYVATTTTQASTKIKNPVQIFEIDISDASKENSEEKSKKIKKAEDVMMKKEQELLNSLDYGAEASIVENSESKDGEEEKFLNDYFAE